MTIRSSMDAKMSTSSSAAAIQNLVVADAQDVPLDGSDTSNPEEEGISSPFDTSKLRIESKSGILDAVLKRMRHGEIDLDPDFQRNSGIWTEQNQSRLIESLMLRIPIPAFYFDATNPDKWLVVDGLQRLTAIRRFVIEQDLRLSGLQFLGKDYTGATFDSLPRSLQRAIMEADIIMYLIMPGTPKEVKFLIFERINTGGLPLSSQEIRHALNQGPVTKMLKSLADSDEFKKATACGVSPRRMDDRECVTRFVVFSLHPAQEYAKGDFDAFLNAGMAEINTLSEPERAALADNFLRVMNYAHALFDDDAFRKRFKPTDTRYPVNKALFEAWSVNLGALSDSELDTLVERRHKLRNKFMEVMHNRDFEAAVTQGTGSTAKVKLRFSEVRRIIHEVLA